ncbi:MAG: MraY family glycosyltransferase, partial [Acidimicrobiia bacterium]
PHNIHPARIFMGDAGSLFLGLLLAATTIVVGGRTADQFSGQTFFFFAPLVIPFVILGVPMLDIALAVGRRALRRQSIAVPDKDHLHHRLMRLGHGQRRAVFILWAWTAVLAGFVLAPTYTNEGNALVPFGIAALALVLYAIFHPVARRTRRDRAIAVPDADLDDVVLLDDEVDLGEAVGGEVIPFHPTGTKGSGGDPGFRGEGRPPRGS